MEFARAAFKLDKQRRRVLYECDILFFNSRRIADDIKNTRNKGVFVIFQARLRFLESHAR